MFSFSPNSVGIVMGRKSTLVALVALLCGAFVVPAAAPAQCRLCDVPTTERTDDASGSAIQLDIEARLDFDQLILLESGGSGSARLNPDGSVAIKGALGALSPRAMVGSVVVRGQPGKAVAIGFPRDIELYGLRGGSIRLTDIASDVGANPRLDSQGELRFRFGGELHIEGEVDGDYRGDLQLTVDYL